MSSPKFGRLAQNGGMVISSRRRRDRRRTDLRDLVYERAVTKVDTPRSAAPLPGPPPRNHRIGLALSGGGFRAVAFHLGALRALHDRGVLDRVDVISAVSGGTLIAAMWAYHDGDFAAFDRQVTRLLQTGLTRDIARTLLLSRRAPQAAAATLRAAVGTMMYSAGTAAKRLVTRGRHAPQPAQPSFSRTVTRTTALRDVLAARLFGHTTIDRPRRDLHEVINATDLRSGSAFRFGSNETGCARYGKLIDNAVPVADAVAASAAFPLLLPAVDRRDTYLGWDGVERRERVVLTDGGVYDNLATTSLSPGRSAAYSTNVHPVDYIVSCDAGYGVLDATAFPMWWPSRVARSFGTVHRKAQDAQRAALHAHKSSGHLRGFAMAFFGQQDRRLPIQPADLIPRSRVVGYPTNFSPTSDDNITAPATRGEQLARLTIEHHCPEIS